MKKVAKKTQRIKAGEAMVQVLDQRGAMDREARLALIQLSIPVSLVAAVREMTEEAEEMG